MLRLCTLTAAVATALALTGSSPAQAARCDVPESMRSRVPVVAGIRTTNVRCDVGRDVARGIIRRYDAGRPVAAALGAPQPAFTVRAVRAHWRGRFACGGRYVELNPEGDLAYEVRCVQRRRRVTVRLYS
jgi:hypothetical protein